MPIGRGVSISQNFEESQVQNSFKLTDAAGQVSDKSGFVVLAGVQRHGCWGGGQGNGRGQGDGGWEDGRRQMSWPIADLQEWSMYADGPESKEVILSALSVANEE